MGFFVRPSRRRRRRWQRSARLIAIELSLLVDRLQRRLSICPNQNYGKQSRFGSKKRQKTEGKEEEERLARSRRMKV